MKSLIAVILLALTQVSYSLDVTKINLAYRYDINDGIKFNYRVTQQGRTVQVYYEVTGDVSTQWEPFFLIQEGYKSVAHDTLSTYAIDTLLMVPERTLLKLTLENPGKNLLLITYSNLQEGIYRIFDVVIKSPAGFPSFLPVDERGYPIINSYLKDSSVALSGESDNYQVYSYLDDFQAADPAMGVMKAIAPTLQIDSVFTSGPMLSGLKTYKFYLVQEDSFSDNGVTLLKTPDYYPKFRRLEELIGPLTYITTPSENKMLTDQMTKKGFEDFWIKTYDTKLRAKTAIKRFYDQVERANLLFTSYKQGWKTDQGMLYIIFGPPDRVERSERSEIWRYDEGVEFEFIRISTLFTASLYSLKRDRKYERIWYNQVGNIRKGL